MIAYIHCHTESDAGFSWSMLCLLEKIAHMSSTNPCFVGICSFRCCQLRMETAPLASLQPRRSVANLIHFPGAEAASKARQLRHAATFSIGYRDPDSDSDTFVGLLRRHLHGQSDNALGVRRDDTLSLFNKSKQSASSPKKRSEKLERALQLRDHCDREFKHFCESKQRPRRSSFSFMSSTRSETFHRALWLELDNGHDEKSAFERLVRRLSPSMKNAATTHTELIHQLQSCNDCATRLTFCARCAMRATDFFDNYTLAELDALYASDLPSPDAKTLDAFTRALADREAHAMQE